jgi:hypothetical protein
MLCDLGRNGYLRIKPTPEALAEHYGNTRLGEPHTAACDMELFHATGFVYEPD